MRPPPPAPPPSAAVMGKALLGTDPLKQPFVLNADFGLGMALKTPLERTNTMRDDGNDPEHDPEYSRGAKRSYDDDGSGGGGGMDDDDGGGGTTPPPPPYADTWQAMENLENGKLGANGKPKVPSHMLRLQVMMRAYRRGRTFGVLENKLLSHTAVSRLGLPAVPILYGAFAFTQLGEWPKYAREEMYAALSRHAMPQARVRLRVRAKARVRVPNPNPNPNPNPEQACDGGRASRTQCTCR